MAKEDEIEFGHPGGTRVWGVEELAKVASQVGRIPVVAVDTLGQLNTPHKVCIRALPYDHSNMMPFAVPPLSPRKE